jgi:hypothetical protein
VNEPKTLLLSETGVELLPDGSTAVNVGPIVRALAFVTDGRGEDRGTDESGNPLPDLMSLAFDVVEAIILGGRKADYFRQVKRDLEAQTGAARSSLALAKQARRVHAPASATALDRAADSLQALLGELQGLSVSAETAQELKQALESFRAFGADRWVSATAQLLVAVSALGPLRPELPAPPRPRPRRKPKKAATNRRAAPAVKKAPARRAKPAVKKKPAPPAKTRPRKQASGKKKKPPLKKAAKRRR